jgi:NAD(P)-dependent dehydrogenase (short-subunit alcohol dehydrogenase family)
MKELGGKVAVVTGAASGIGNALATRFAAEGMKVVLADVEEDALNGAAKRLADTGAEVLPVVTDVSKVDQVTDLAHSTFDAFGTAHVVCNNAGVATGGPIWQLTEADWAWVLGVNLWGVIHGISAFVPRLVEQGEGHVVNTASIAGLTSAPLMAPYNASKHAVVTISETLQHELTLHGSPVKVSVLCPGWVNTRIADAERNRPPELRNPEDEIDPVGEAAQSFLRNLLTSGLDPAEVAAMVFDAVRDERFYVLTHPEMTRMVQARMEEIIEGRTPTLSWPGA